ncbi:HNH endonuclease [Phocaeicola barnesiae]|jgi:hypothetical protein|uniref:HNH endonuclease n=1 Tax=Phocaeicola barnesiae TaxID=376804 RepID=UPI0025A34FF0|nr:HNH endonuclease [Phocaeicola barnesiae]MDM8242373.1 HNH endonuclease [Phocaeicola barnesiae]
MVKLKTKNQTLINSICNGVPYVKKCFTLYGIEVCGVFPVFQGIKVTLDGTVDSLYKELGNTDYAFYHGTMKLATKKLKQMMMDNPEIRNQFSMEQIKDIETEKEKISGLIWHHYEELDGEKPIMQLVDEKLHSACSHTGGSYTWNKKHLI